MKDSGAIRECSCDMLRGTATHAAIEAALNHKMDTSGACSGAEYIAVIPSVVESEWSKVRLHADELVVGAEISKNHLIHDATRAAECYIKQEVPDIVPIGIETKFILKHPSWGNWTVEGRLDIVEDGLIRDIKTTKHPLSKADENVAHDSDQLTMYALAYFAETGKIPKVQLDYVVLTERAHVVSRPSERNMADLQRIIERVASTINAIERLEASPPTIPLPPAVRGRWGSCKQSSCSFWSSCPMGGGTPTLTLNGLESVPCEE